MTITINLTDDTGLDSGTAAVWVAGWINGGSNDSKFKLLKSGGTFEDSGGTSKLPFHHLPDVASIALNEPTNGDDRLLFVVAKNQPDPLNIDNASPIQYAQYPYAVEPGDNVQPAGPFDVFEFGMNAQFNVTAVSGFGLNLRFSAQDPDTRVLQHFGMESNVSRAQIGAAYQAFIAREEKSYSAAGNYAELLYKKALPGTTYMPPMIEDEYFAICDPNDMLTAKSSGYSQKTDDPLANFWDETVKGVFKPGNKVSITLGSTSYPGLVVDTRSLNPPPTPPTNCTPLAFEFPIGTEKKYIFCPQPDLQTARFVFKQDGFTTPDYGQGDTPVLSQLQNNLVEAICRGVALDGIRSGVQDNDGFSTKAWINWKNWYPSAKACHFYAKFLHCSDADGNDSRISGKPPIMQGGAAYGFSMDENPSGLPTTVKNVPSKTPFNVSSGTVELAIGPWK